MKAFIIMADIIDSSTYPGDELMEDFKNAVTQINKNNIHHIASPLTITLGDEFQGIVKGLNSAISIIFQLDELTLKSELDYKLRYVVNYGVVDTDINKKNSYEMLGEGLTTARKKIEELKSSNSEIEILGIEEKSSAKLNIALRLYRSIYNDWYQKDKSLVCEFLQDDNYRALAEKHGRDPSSMWRKKKSLKIEDFKASKELIELLANEE